MSTALAEAGKNSGTRADNLPSEAAQSGQMKPNQTCQCWPKQWLSVDIGVEDQQRTVPHLKLSDIRSLDCVCARANECTSNWPTLPSSVCIWHRALLIPVDAQPKSRISLALAAPRRLNHRLNEHYFSPIIF